MSLREGIEASLPLIEKRNETIAKLRQHIAELESEFQDLCSMEPSALTELIERATRAAALCPMTRTPDEQSAIDTVLLNALAGFSFAESISTLPADESSEAESRRQICACICVLDFEHKGKHKCEVES